MTTTPIAPPPPPATGDAPRARNRAGTVALVLGIVGLVAAFIPVLSYVAGVVGLVAVVLGIIGVTKAGLPKGAAITGLILGALAVVLAIVMSVVYTTLFFIAGVATSLDHATDAPSAVQPSEAASGGATDDGSASGGSNGAAADRTVTYVVRGSGRAQSITYLTINNGESGSEQVAGTRMPWKKAVKIADDELFSTSVFSLVAQNSGSGRITCEIKADGKVISKHSSSGRYAVVSCSGTTK